MCWDGVLPHFQKSLSKTAFDHPQPIGREGLLTCLLHFSLRFKSVIVSAVSQMLTKNLNTIRCLNISDPHHLSLIFHLRGLLNTSISPHSLPEYSISGELFNSPPYPEILKDFKNTSIFSSYPQQYSISRNLGGLSNHLHFLYHPQQYSISRELPAIVSIINLSSCL